uniref:Uncharacterized protein n=1 Tax=viral metagenome TaxID=1070528 RepID=A0A6C0E180_9ZZZZ
MEEEKCPSLLDVLGFLNFPDLEKLRSSDEKKNQTSIDTDIQNTLTEIQSTLVTLAPADEKAIQKGGSKNRKRSKKRSI